ncbi:hypothetical protein ACS8Y6_03760 [Salinisphaera sp. RV14]|uniref:hypothetical protein n=1 Tax=unclassified Salinisphaera TaxID=2649847 RepID=UPI003F82CCCE
MGPDRFFDGGRFEPGVPLDGFGAPRAFAAMQAVCGAVSIASGFAITNELLFIERVIVAIAGVSLVLGIPHVAQRLDAEEVDTADISELFSFIGVHSRTVFFH